MTIAPNQNTGVLDLDVPMNASSSGTSLIFNMSPRLFSWCLLKIKWTGADATDATAKLQISDNGSDWADYPDDPISLNSADGVDYWDFDIRAIPQWQVVYTSGSNTTGTFTTSFNRETE